MTQIPPQNICKQHSLCAGLLVEACMEINFSELTKAIIYNPEFFGLFFVAILDFEVKEYAIVVFHRK